METMMTADELRSLADTLEQCSPFRDSASVYQAANYLRACADALEAGPVAWRNEVRGNGTHGVAASEWRHYTTTSSRDTADRHLLTGGAGIEARAVPLYPLAMPSIPQGWKLVPVEPTPDMLEDGANTIRDNGGNARWSDVREAWDNMLSAAPTPPVAAQSLRLPEPMTDAEVDHYGKRALMGHLPVREMIRAIETETLRRVKEANK